MKTEVKAVGKQFEVLVSKQYEQQLRDAMDEYQINEGQMAHLSRKQQEIFVLSQMTSDDLLGQARLEGEDFDTYRERRRMENMWAKNHCRGQYAWVSVSLEQDEQSGFWFNKGGGTYKKDVHGLITPGQREKDKKYKERKEKREARKS